MLPSAQVTHMIVFLSKYAFFPPVQTQVALAVFSVASEGHDTHFPLISIASLALHTHVPFTSSFRLFVQTH